MSRKRHVTLKIKQSQVAIASAAAKVEPGTRRAAGNAYSRLGGRVTFVLPALLQKLVGVFWGDFSRGNLAGI